MPAGKHKSRSLRRVFTRVISKTKLTYKKRKPKAAHCANCKAELKGMPRLRPFQAQNTSKSQKRPSRPFGGKLCSKCTKAKIKSSIKE